MIRLLKKKVYLKASATIEASIVMPVCLISIVTMILFGMRIHDAVLSAMVANEAVELYGHLSAYDDGGRISIYGNERLNGTLSGEAASLSIEEYRDGSRVILNSAGKNRYFEDPGFRPENTMRRMTLIEVVADNE